MKTVDWPESYYEKFRSENVDVVDFNERKDRMYTNLISRPKASFLGKLSESYYSLFLNTFLYRIGEKEAWKFYQAFLKLEKDYLKLVLSNGERTEITVYGETLSIQDPTVNDGGILVEGWNRDLSRAVVARDHELIKTLVEMPFNKVYNKSIQHEEYVYKYYEFLKALYTKGDETYTEKLKEAILYTFPDKLKWSKPDDPRFMLMHMEMYLHLLSGDEDELNNIIVKYLEEGKQFTLKMREGFHWYSDFIDIGVLEICSIAYDRGMKISVQSPYIPEWLYKGEFRNWK